MLEKAENLREKEDIERKYQEKLKNKNKLIKKLCIGFVSILFVISTMFLFFQFRANAKINDLQTEIIQLLEKHNIKITDVHIREKLTEIGELATMEFEYENMKTVEDSRKLFGHNVIGTTKSIEIIYAGIIKVGYNVDNIQFEIDQERKVISFALPAAEVLDNYIILDKMKTTDKNNLFNPIGSDDVIKYFGDIQQEELKIAEEQGIYEKAEEQMKMIIENFFMAFPDYNIMFVD